MSDPKKQCAAERRSFGRRNTFKCAAIHTPAGEVAHCVIVNLSAGGAMLQLRSEPLPLDDFELLIEEDNILVSCHVVHRTEGRVGVQFTRSPRRASQVCRVKHERMQPYLASIFPKPR